MGKQRTMAKSMEFSGQGIHTGEKVTVKVEPADCDHGIVFVKGNVFIAANTDNVIGTTRSTSLGIDNLSICTVEHFLAACLGMGVHNLKVTVEGSEIPAMDGSSLEIARMLREAGIVDQEKDRSLLEIKKNVTVRRNNSFIVGMPASRFSLTVRVDYNHPLVGIQMFQFTPEDDDFEEKIAPARTFAFKEEVQELLDQQLALGGTLDNALVIDNQEYLNPPRFNDEVVRHKCLDFLGDLALAGTEVHGHIFANKPGHRINVEFVRALLGKL